MSGRSERPETRHAAWARAEAVAARGRSPLARGTYHVLRFLAEALAVAYVSFEVVGRDRLPASGPFIISPVHRSNVDFSLPALMMRRRVRWMAKDSIYVGGPLDRFLYAMGAFPVNRSGLDREALLIAEAVLARGEPLVMFPEGRRKAGQMVEDLYDGPAFMACRQRVPIVPVGIGGSDKAMPIGSRFLRPRKIVVLVGEPIYPDVPVEGRVGRGVVRDLTAQLRDAIQALYDEAQQLAS